MEHIFIKGKEESPVFILFHGTGGDEYSLIPLAKELATDYSILSLRGAVNENGALRFFKRKAEGIYDEQDLVERGLEISRFIKEASVKYGFSLSKTILVGFSNGANIAIELLLKDISNYRRALLFAPMFPIAVKENHSLSHLSLFISMGKNDPIVPLSESERVQKLFTDRLAKVETCWVQSHEISPLALLMARDWLKNNQI